MKKYIYFSKIYLYYIMYQLGILELFCEHVYGITENSTPNIQSYFIVNDVIQRNDLLNYQKLFKDHKKYKRQYLTTLKRFINLYYDNRTVNSALKNAYPQFSNIEHIINSDDYFTINIIKIEKLIGGELVGYPLGSFWLKIFQRKWKSYYYKKINYYKKNIHHMLNREIGI